MIVRCAVSASSVRNLVVLQPPSTASTCPLIHPEAADDRKKIAFATSSTVPMRVDGVMSPSAHVRVEAGEMLGRFGFPRNRWNDDAQYLSHGDRKRLDILMLDEPTAGM